MIVQYSHNDAGWSPAPTGVARGVYEGQFVDCSIRISMSEDMCVVYLLENNDGKKYIGFTSNLQKRIQYHNEGKSTFTKSRGPWMLKWQSKPMTASEARKLELLIS